MTSLRVTFFSTVHPHPWAPNKGVFNAAMLKGLAREGVDVRAIVPVPWTERRGAAQAIASDYPVEFVPFWYLPRLAPLALAQQLAWSAAAVLGRAAADRRGVMLGYWADPDGTALVQVARRHGLPVVQMVGGSDVLLLSSHPARGRRILQTLAKADRILTVGAHLRDTLIGRGLPPGLIQVFQRGVDRSVFHPGDQSAMRRALGLPEDRHVLLWVGRMVPVKGLDVLLKAMGHPALAATNPLLVLVGDGPQRAALERQARTSLAPGAVRFVGSVTHGELAAWYRAADLMVLPSRSEGVPNVLLEALACGTGFVASDVGSIWELASSPEHDLVPAGDPDRLAVALAAGLTRDASPTVEVPDFKESARRLHAALAQVGQPQD